MVSESPAALEGHTAADHHRRGADAKALTHPAGVDAAVPMLLQPAKRSVPVAIGNPEQHAHQQMDQLSVQQAQQRCCGNAQQT